ncbi:MAG: FMN-binding negative transcriptional regulator [Mobilicoccus sp.]|nr:FMN-binding negative transcriptional regulator [Mobilicoccus sp.]
MPYLPEHDRVEDRDLLLDVIARHPLATLVTHDGDEPDADLIPLLARPGPDGEVDLIGHVARSNPLWEKPQSGPVLAVFTAAEHYISPSWYPSKAEHHRVVPTWNYVVVHAWGELLVHDDPKWVRGVVSRLTQHQESGRDEPWRLGMAPGDYVDEQLARIVGVSIRVARLSGKFKVSAHRSEADRLGARDGVAGGSAELARYMTDPPNAGTV